MQGISWADKNNLLWTNSRDLQKRKTQESQEKKFNTVCLWWIWELQKCLVCFV